MSCLLSDFQFIVNFKTLHPDIEFDILNTIITLPNVENSFQPSHFISEFCKDFDYLSQEKIFENTNSLINRLIDIIQNNVSIKTCVGISSHWPPIIPLSIIHLKSIFNMLVRIVYTLKKPNNFLFWATSKLFPKFWNKKNLLNNNYLKAYSKCYHPEFGKKILWAILDNQFIFYLYLIEKSNSTILFEFEIGNLKLLPDEQISIYNKKKEKILTIKLIDSLQCNMWLSLFEENSASFPFFLSGYNKTIPQPIITSFYDCCISSDMLLSRCLIDPKLTKVNDSTLIIESLFNIIFYSQKINLFYSMIISSLFDNPSLTITSDFYNNHNIIEFLNFIFNQFGKPYFFKFVIKIINYIDSFSNLQFENINDLHSIEVIFFTILKYIINSIDLIPLEIKHIASILRSYFMIRFNDNKYLFNLLSKFFFDSFLLILLEKPNLIKSDLQIQNILFYKSLIGLLKAVFNQEPLSNINILFKKWDERLKYHIYPKLELFLFSLGDIKNIPKYKIPKINILNDSLHILLDHISNNYKDFIKVFKYISSSNTLIGGPLGWNLSSIILNSFQFIYDSNNFKNYIVAIHKNHEIENLNQKKKNNQQENINYNNQQENINYNNQQENLNYNNQQENLNNNNFDQLLYQIQEEQNYNFDLLQYDQNNYINQPFENVNNNITFKIIEEKNQLPPFPIDSFQNINTFNNFEKIFPKNFDTNIVYNPFIYNKPNNNQKIPQLPGINFGKNVQKPFINEESTTIFASKIMKEILAKKEENLPKTSRISSTNKNKDNEENQINNTPKSLKKKSISNKTKDNEENQINTTSSKILKKKSSNNKTKDNEDNLIRKKKK